MQSIPDDFESRFAESLFSLLPQDCRCVALGVSGGADSIAMLTAAAHVLPRNVRIAVITVDHNIRPAQESGADAEFVARYCAGLASKGHNVSCAIKTLAQGQVARTASIRGGGTEEAARFLRYSAFGSHMAQCAAQAFATAHTKNDQIETLVMRFLQGGSGGGIPARRGAYIRPLLGFERSEIEAYLNELKISWRTDSTNSDTRYLRNKIRHEVLPVLDSACTGWRNAALAAAERARADNEALSAIAEKEIVWQTDGTALKTEAAAFCSQPKAVQRRAVLHACTGIGAQKRVCHALIRRIQGRAPDAVWSDRSSGISCDADGTFIYVRKAQEQPLEEGYALLIEAAGTYKTPLGPLRVQAQDGMAQLALCGHTLSLRVRFPFYVRSRCIGDTVLAADKRPKSVADICSDWKLGRREKALLPVVQELQTKEQSVVCLWGACVGGKNWIVRPY